MSAKGAWAAGGELAKRLADQRVVAKKTATPPPESTPPVSPEPVSAPAQPAAAAPPPTSTPPSTVAAPEVVAPAQQSASPARPSPALSLPKVILPQKFESLVNNDKPPFAFSGVRTTPQTVETAKPRSPVMDGPPALQPQPPSYDDTAATAEYNYNHVPAHAAPQTNRGRHPHAHHMQNSAPQYDYSMYQQQQQYQNWYQYGGGYEQGYYPQHMAPNHGRGRGRGNRSEFQPTHLFSRTQQPNYYQQSYPQAPNPGATPYYPSQYGSNQYYHQQQGYNQQRYQQRAPHQHYPAAPTAPEETPEYQ